jgi:hypothetical protein
MLLLVGIVGLVVGGIVSLGLLVHLARRVLHRPRIPRRGAVYVFGAALAASALAAGGVGVVGAAALSRFTTVDGRRPVADLRCEVAAEPGRVRLVLWPVDEGGHAWAAASIESAGASCRIAGTLLRFRQPLPRLGLQAAYRIATTDRSVGARASTSAGPLDEGAAGGWLERGVGAATLDLLLEQSLENALSAPPDSRTRRLFVSPAGYELGELGS